MILTCTLTTVVEYHTLFELQGFPFLLEAAMKSLPDTHSSRGSFSFGHWPLACARALAH